MKKNSPVDLEDFYFFLYENPFTNGYKKQFRKGDEKKTEEEIRRQYENNLIWRKKLFDDIIKKAIEQGIYLSEKLNWKTQPTEQTGLDAWI